MVDRCVGLWGFALAVLLSLPARAEPSAADAPLAPPAPTEGTSSAFVPALEMVGIVGTIATFNRFVLEAPWSYVSVDSIRDNATAAWVFDEDDFAINQVGHPYQGSLYFTAARSSGLSFWGSLPYASLGSFLWEVAGETEKPSINDQITTGYAGALLGEALYRVWFHMFDGDHAAPRWLRAIIGTAAAPMATLNRLAFPGRSAGLIPRDEFQRFSIGANFAGRVIDESGPAVQVLGYGRQVSVGVTLTHGFPSPGMEPPLEPFDHFDLRLDGAFISQPHIGLFTRGTLWVTDFSARGWIHGLWGLFGSYDYSTLPLLRVSTSALGPGAAARFDFADGVTLQATGIVSGIFFGSAGSTPTVEGFRDYHIGGGAQMLVDLRLLLRDAGALTAGVRNYGIFGLPSEPGIEAISYGWMGAELRVIGKHTVGIEAQWSARAADYVDAGRLSYAGNLFRVYYAIISDTRFGAGR